MKITTEHTIWCERCSAWTQEAVKSKPRFEHQMRLGGWRTRVGKTVCPECVKELSAGKLWNNVGHRPAAE